MAEGVGPQHGRDERGRPAWLLPVALTVAVVVVAGIVVGVVLARQRSVPAAAPAPLVTTIAGPPATPRVAPSPRASTTAFTALLPASVLQYALTTSTPATDWQAAGALEAWSDTYSDGRAGKVTVLAGQWPDAASATAFAATLTAALPTGTASGSASAPASGPASASASADTAPSAGPALPRSGKVTVAGATTGSYTVVAAADGTGIAVWTNGTAVFRLVAPLADVLDAYAAYPL